MTENIYNNRGKSFRPLSRRLGVLTHNVIRLQYTQNVSVPSRGDWGF